MWLVGSSPLRWFLFGAGAFPLACTVVNVCKDGSEGRCSDYFERAIFRAYLPMHLHAYHMSARVQVVSNGLRTCRASLLT